MVAGIVLIAVRAGVYHVFKGWTKGFLLDLNKNPGVHATPYRVVGYIANGVALGVVGVLLVSGAAQNSSSKPIIGLRSRLLREQRVGAGSDLPSLPASSDLC